MPKHYWTCPYCGANLDPGERCDCRDEREAAPPEWEQPNHYGEYITDSTSLSTGNGGYGMENENSGQESRELIAVRQVPVIEENLLEARKAVEARIADALAMACTEETYKAVKKIRSDLRKEYADLEARRKAVKAAILAPYDKFEDAYKENIGDFYTNADKKLKARIDEVEDGLRAQKETEVRAHFDQCRVTFGIDPDLVSFERSGVKVTISASTGALKAKATEYLSRIAGDLELIETQDHKDEVMAEYRKTLDVSTAVLTVKQRHEEAEQERKRREAEEAAKAAEQDSSPVSTSIPVTEPSPASAPVPDPVSEVLPFTMDDVHHGTPDYPENCDTSYVPFAQD
ncbi:MAG: DUF1351 domain-containing protein, partial [Oscillibacter sp.]|nr:DUF1351 domain-containing protein [Oscillibacter sp.]